MPSLTIMFKSFLWPSIYLHYQRRKKREQKIISSLCGEIRLEMCIFISTKNDEREKGAK